MSYLESVRTPIRSNHYAKMLLISFGIFWIGVILGVFSKYLDYHVGNYPAFLMTIDHAVQIRKFFDGISPWMTGAICVSVYSNSPTRAEINIFCFNIGMIASYYVYAFILTGEFPMTYLLVWVLLVLFSPVFGAICWYAKGNGIPAFLVSGAVIAVMINVTFHFGFMTIAVRNTLNLVMLFAAIIHMKRPSVEGTFGMAMLGAVIGVVVGMVF